MRIIPPTPTRIEFNGTELKYLRQYINERSSSYTTGGRTKEFDKKLLKATAGQQKSFVAESKFLSITGFIVFERKKGKWNDVRIILDQFTEYLRKHGVSIGKQYTIT